MKIAVLGIKALPASAGADRVVEKLLENVSPAHDYWIYLVRRNGVEPAQCHDNLHFVHLPALPGKHLRAFSYFFLCAIHVLFKARVDLAHIHNSDFGLFCPLLRLKRRMPVIGTFHGDPYLRQKWGLVARVYLKLSERFFAQFCDMLTSVSPAKTRVRGLTRTVEVRHIPNGIDAHWTPAEQARFDLAGHGLAEGEYILFAAGRVDSTKGLHYLIDAYGRKKRRERLLVVGDFGHDADYSAKIDRLAAENPDVVLYKGLLSKDLLFDVIRRSALCVFPSDVEAMSMMLLEFISCRKLVVCSDIVENVAVVGRDHRFLFRAGDPDDLTEKLDAALAERDGESLVQALYERCLKVFEWKTIVRNYEELYPGLTH